ncbi:MAG: DUF2971 domain-containing protein [Planctomycetaceae bacterium]|jgi:hypothetical protein|nr:DUF2971 domain-containing protein [Planctomycetaceae bacterium]MBT6153084.1 DUF2971 domain-containing protein [Planctomycetaceae bacterium]MBT6487929.1 DUF2971 domain-containing protein [Planctomycetaceae bacterium]MBT6494522.1 DUF2971 domain-containing protein [Planctomycetaceae bacterium]
MKGSFFNEDREFHEIAQRYQPSSSPDQLVYHYTNSCGLLGISQTQELWATHFQDTNDAQEVQYGIDLTLANIEGKLSGNDSKQPAVSLDTFFDDVTLKPSEALLRVGAETLRDGRLFTEFYELYLTCFSLNGNSLSQWRAYADDARGFAIGLPSSNLRNLPNGFDLGADSLDLLDVVYEPEIQNRLIDEVILMVTSRCDAAAEKIESSERKRFLIDFNSYLVSCVIRIAVHLKHPGFHEEQERRLIYAKKMNTSNDEAAPNLVRTRASSSGLIRFLPLSIRDGAGRVPIEEIIIGPKAESGQAAEGAQYEVKNLFTQNEQQIPPFIPSGIPYR